MERGLYGHRVVIWTSLPLDEFRAHVQREQARAAIDRARELVARLPIAHPSSGGRSCGASTTSSAGSTAPSEAARDETFQA